MKTAGKAKAPRRLVSKSAAAAAAAPQRASKQRTPMFRIEDEEEDGAAQEEEEEEEEAEDAEEARPPARQAKRSFWAIQGELTGTAMAERVVPFDATVPERVLAAGEQAACDYAEALLAAFKSGKAPAAAPSSPDDELLVGRRSRGEKPRKKTRPDVPTGVEGLASKTGASALSTVVYGLLRTHFFLPDDDGAAAIRAYFQEDSSFSFNDGEFDEYWKSTGHALARMRGKAARHAILKAMKSAIFEIYGALAASNTTVLTSRSLAHSRRPAPHQGRQGRVRLRQGHRLRQGGVRTRYVLGWRPGRSPDGALAPDDGGGRA